MKINIFIYDIHQWKHIRFLFRQFEHQELKDTSNIDQRDHATIYQYHGTEYENRICLNRN
jgi:hypothetical protein